MLLNSCLLKVDFLPENMLRTCWDKFFQWSEKGAIMIKSLLNVASFGFVWSPKESMPVSRHARLCRWSFWNLEGLTWKPLTLKESNPLKINPLKILKSPTSFLSHLEVASFMFQEHRRKSSQRRLGRSSKLGRLNISAQEWLNSSPQMTTTWTTCPLLLWWVVPFTQICNIFQAKIAMDKWGFSNSHLKFARK